MMMAGRIVHAPPPPPPPDPRRLERMAFENALRLWGLSVRFAVRDLLSLGRSFEARYALDPRVVPMASDPLELLGLELLAVLGSPLLQVKSAHARGRCPRWSPGGLVPTAGDYLVGLDADDLLVAPLELSQCRKLLLERVRAPTATTLTLRFVRLDAVALDPARGLTHGRVLHVLEGLGRTHAQLKTRYDELLGRNRQLTNERLNRPKKLLSHLRQQLQRLRAALHGDPAFAFTAQFQTWYVEMLDSWAPFDDHDDGETDGDDDDLEGDGDEDMAHGEKRGHRPPASGSCPVRAVPPETPSLRALLGPRGPATHQHQQHRQRNPQLPSATATAATSRQTDVYGRLHELGAGIVNLEWIDVLDAAQMRWLPNRHVQLTRFIEALVGGFLLDGAWRPSIPGLCRRIAQHLVQVYALRLRSNHVDNTTVKKDFAQHVRMLRSNITNAGNQQLRADLLSGAVTVPALCEMNSEQLAPEALQADRLRRYQQHAKEITIQPPVGPTLVKTKHGYKEVNFGGLAQESQAPSITSQVGDDESMMPAAEPSAVESHESTGTATERTDESDHAVDIEDDSNWRIPRIVPVPATQDVQRHAPNDSSSAITEAHGGTMPSQSTESSTDEVVERFNQALELEKTSTSKQKRVTFGPSTHFIIPSRQPHADSLATGKSVTTQQTRAQPINPPPSDRPRDRSSGRPPFTVDNARTFLRVLFDPSQNLVEMLEQFQTAVNSIESIPTMSSEFSLAEGVKLYRSMAASRAGAGALMFHARVQLAHWTFDGSDPSDRNALVSAVYRLRNALVEFQRLFGDMLDNLATLFHLHIATDSRKANDSALSYLVSNKIAKLSDPRPVPYSTQARHTMEEFEVDAVLDGLVLARCRDHSVIQARNRAAQELTQYLGMLIKLKHGSSPNQQELAPVNSESIPTTQSSSTPPNQGVHPRLWREDNNRPTHSNYYSSWDQGVEATESTWDHKQRSQPATADRKRHLEPSHDPAQPPTSRRRHDWDGPRENYPQQPQQPPAFVVDKVGESAQTPAASLTEKQRVAAVLDAYREFVSELLKNPECIYQRIKAIEWDVNKSCQEIELSPHFRITRAIVHDRAGNSYTCELEALDGMIKQSKLIRSVDEANEATMQLAEKALKEVAGDWKTFVIEYIRILDRKKKEKGNQADPRLSAANEVLKSKLVNQWVWEQTRPAAHLSEFSIIVRGRAIIRHTCLNEKMARRSATEDFRDRLDRLVQYAAAWSKGSQQNEAKSAPIAPPSASSVSRNLPASVPSRTVASTGPSPVRVSNMVHCSDDSDDDDDGDFHGGYSDDDDWEPSESTQATTTSRAQPSYQIQHSPALAKTASMDQKQLRSRVDEVMSEPYMIEQEASGADDGRFRAIIRSLFTPEDELCNNISGLRGALKYAGSFNKMIVPNVKATIGLQRLREETFDVETNVNSVVVFKAAASSKQEACNIAIDGLLNTLNGIRSTWVQLLHFLHVKELGVSNLLDSFNALRLANIVSITTSIEPPPSMHAFTCQVDSKMETKVHCVLRIGDYAVFRVSDDSEDEARMVANAKTVKFMADLIDLGLDPEPVHDVVSNQPTANSIFDPMPAVDWSCTACIQDFGDPSKRVEFQLDISWCRLPQRQLNSDPMFSSPDSRITLDHIDRISMPRMERQFGSPNHPDLYFFRMETPFEQGKFVNLIAEYGHKNKQRTVVLEFRIRPLSDYAVFVFPPGASINSENNLYWSRQIMPRELTDRKAVYGVLMPVNLRATRFGRQ